VIMRLVRDPLLHMLLAGALIYLVHTWAQPETADDEVIIVDESALVSFIAKRTGGAISEAAGARLAAMSESELDLLIKDYVREQALLREALRLGFGGDDYVMERRLVQRLEFALLTLARAEARPSEDALRDFYADNTARYEVPARITFTHVYVNPEQRGKATTEDANKLLRTLRIDAVDFAEAIRYGDRFLYHRAYVDRPFEDIASHFGKDMAEALFARAPSPMAWSGPHISTHGTHLVLVSELRQARTPPFEAVRTAVERDHARALEQNALEHAVQRIIDRQRVRIELSELNMF